MQKVKIVVISGGLGTPSSSRMLADVMVEETQAQLAKQGLEAEVSIIELRDYATEITKMLINRYAPPEFQNVIDTVVGADALVAVSPVFNGSMSGLFKLFFDILEPDALRGKPVLIGATGGSPRHSLVVDYVIRPMFAYLRTLSAPTGIYAAADDWGAGEEGLAPLGARVEKAAIEFVDQILFALSLRSQGQSPVEPNPIEDKHSFKSLMSTFAGVTVQ